MKKLTDDTLLAHTLAWVARMVFRHRQVIIYSQLVLFVLSVLITVKYLRFDTNRDNLVGQNEKYQHSFMEYKKEFPAQDDLAVVVESEDIEKNRQFIERLGAKVLAQPLYFTNVIFNNDLKMLGRKALLFVPEPDLVELRNQLKGYVPFIEKFGRTTNLVSFFDLLNREFRTASQETNAQTESLVGALPALDRILTQADDSLHRPGIPPSPGITALFDPTGSAQTNIYVTYNNARLFVLSAEPTTTNAPGADAIQQGKDQDDHNADCVLLLRKLVAQTQLEVTGVNAGVTGMPVLDYDEMVQSQKDTTVASIVSLVICALIFIYGYNETGRPIKATICLIVGLAYTLAFATIVIGHVNILTVTFVPMLVGLAIDFGVHLITRYEEELRLGKSEEAALMTAMVFTGQGIFTGAFTTAGAFLAMWFTRFKGIQEMGLICGGGLVVCFIPMMTLLPVLLLRGRQNVIDHEVGEPKHRAKIENLWLKRPGIVLAITVVLCALAATQIGKVRFDYNVLKLQSTSLASVQTEEKLIHSAGQSLLYGAVIADTPQEAVRKEVLLTNLTSVASVQTMANYLIENPTNKLRLIGEIKGDLAPLQFKQPDRRLVDMPGLSRTLFSFGGYCAAAIKAIGTNEPALSEQFRSLRATIEKLRRDMMSGSDRDVAENAQQLAAFQQALFNDLRETFEALKQQDGSAGLRVEDLPPALRNMFIGVTGKFLVQVYPKKDVWQRENQKVFIDQVRAVDPNLTGMPVQLYEYTELLKDSYVQAAWYSLAAIILLILFHFRNISSVILSLMPVAIGSIWLGGLMGLFHVPLNPANIMILPLVIGIGVTNGIHILNRYAEEQVPSILSRSTGKAVFVSGLTAIAGFGSLILAKDRGIHSLGIVMAAGVTSCMVAALMFLPTLLNLMTKKRPPENKQPSVDNALSTLGQEEPR
jgi:hopanoid biosynthesis associated RND transporter like protein HpnN